MEQIIELKVPDIGDFESVEVIEVLIKAGDEVVINQDIITLESDKASMEIPANKTGVIKQVNIAVGDRVSQGTIIASLIVNQSGTEPEPDPELEPEPKPEPQPKPEPEPEPELKPEDKKFAVAIEQAEHTHEVVREINRKQLFTHASPSVRSFARELGVDLSQINGSGIKNRITKKDVQAFVKKVVNQKPTTIRQENQENNLPVIELPDFTKFGATTKQDLSRIKKISAKHLRASWLNIPHVSQFDEVDISDLEKFRQENKGLAKAQGANLTPLVFIMKAVVASLKANPNFNGSLSADQKSLILKQYYNLGVAVDTPGGLVVPVIKDVDTKSFLQLAIELKELSEKARLAKLKPEDIQGGTFTISSLGGIGGSFFTPIINAPEVAILGVGRSQIKPVYNGKKFKPRLMLPLSLSYDHRIIDGASGARFIVHLGKMLTDIRKVLL